MSDFDINKISFEGCLVSPFDGRDYNLKCATGVSDSEIYEVEYPKEYIIPNLSNIYSQGSTSMCVAFTLAEMKESQEMIDQNRRIRFSPGFIYGNRDETSEGMYIRQAIKTLKIDGVCTYDEFPIKGTCQHCQEKFAELSDEIKQSAKDWRIGSYYRIYTLEEVKYTLMNIGPIAISVPVYTAWNSINGQMKEGGTLRGYHAMLIIGWKDNDTLIIQNSWGSLWGNKGRATCKFGEYPILEMWAVTDYNYSKNVQQRSWLKSIILFISNLLKYIFRKRVKKDE